MSQLNLLRRRRFAAIFCTQFLGAFNDNLFKNALMILITYKSMSVLGLAPGDLVALSGAIFTLPFFLFSATAGQLADKLSKPKLVHWIKLAEIAIMILGAVGFMTGNLWLLLTVLFLMGLHSTFFGPVKYSILPQLLTDDELVGGNALVEMGTFLAILLGTIAGGVVIASGDAGLARISAAVIGVAIAGYLASLRIPTLPAENPSLPFTWNPVRPMMETYSLTRSNRTVFLSVLGASWFWFFGAAILALLPAYTKDHLHATEGVVTLFLAAFCTGIGIGSLLCERLSDRKLELGLVPFGSIGMTLFTFDLFLAGGHIATAASEPIGVVEFLRTPGGLRICLDLLFLSSFGGMYIVPLYTLIQQRTEAAYRSRVVAGNNILGALFMVASALMVVALGAVGLSIPQVFLVLALLNAAVAAYIYRLMPEFLFRFIAWILSHILYRLRVVGRENIPLDGPVLLVCNHVSFIDWLIIASGSKRPPRFVMYHGFLKTPLLGWIFRDAKVIPIAPAHESEETMAAAFDRIAEELEAGELVCIFPEGKITSTGELNVFRTGVEKIVQRTPVPVVPMALKGMWGSFFSRKGGAAMRRPFRRFWSRIELVIGEPIPPDQVTAELLAERVAALGGFAAPSIGSSEPVPAPVAAPAR
jgi:1-acyl-sn-glycerol-3-phosphate acyltransferase